MKLTKQNIIRSLIDYAFRSNESFNGAFDNSTYFGFPSDELEIIKNKSFKKIVIESQGEEYYERIIRTAKLRKEQGVNND
tara:strand:+ start:3250 stop:3489 length:240 start_codon:yes stop_codon:yes gene_type:complete